MTDDNAAMTSKWIGIGLAGLMLGVFSVTSLAGQEQGVPADKAAASGSTVEIMTASVQDGSTSEVHTVLESTIRTSSTTDLLLQVTAECALWTDVTTIGNDENRAVATVKVWVEIDGEPVTVDGSEDGESKAVFCNRDYKVVTTQFENENATIERYLRTRSANAFNWIQLDLGSGIHDIAVKAQLEGQATEDANAKAAIGSRTLIIEPTKMAQDATI